MLLPAFVTLCFRIANVLCIRLVSSFQQSNALEATPFFLQQLLLPCSREVDELGALHYQMLALIADAAVLQV